jgi:P27 family predicted phage terminase small subunit
MRGAKPKLKNVVPMRPDDVEVARLRQKAIRRAIAQLMPRGKMSDELKAEWRRVAKILADPTVDRLKARYVDTILEYCRATVRLRNFREAMPTLNLEVYRVQSRNGDQVKSHPYVAQLNETWRQWRSLVAMLGLSPTDERNLLPGQGDLFDESEKYF